MTDPIETLIICSFLLGTAAVLWLVVRRAGAATREKTRAELGQKREAELSKAVAAGTHDAQGYPLCRSCGVDGRPETRATHHGIQFIRSEGLWSWVLQSLGAPARIRVGLDAFKDYAFCRECFYIAEAEARALLLEIEQERRNAAALAEVRLRQFERYGLVRLVRTKVDEHAREQERIARQWPGVVGKA